MLRTGMKRLLLMRHAKSDWGSPGLRDHDRPLAPRGRKAAPRVGKWLTAVGWVPDQIVSSTAERALSTAALAADAGDWPGEVMEERGLYGCSVADLWELVVRQPDDVEALMLVGHEPTWSAAVGALTGGSIIRMPTGAVAGMVFPQDAWGSARPGSAELRFLMPPRLLAR